MRERSKLGFRYRGAEDDPDYEIRLAAKRVKGAASSRKYRATRSSGKRRGRPSLNLSPEEKQARSNAQAAARMYALRLRKNALRHLIHIVSVTDFSAPHEPVRKAISTVNGISMKLLPVWMMLDLSGRTVSAAE
ncbi:hypothetical protein BRADO3932 [Bradyrhizobium sp. ORS 278]|uniref:hypothetical protein n=1 Tax=Bradyrhizobium sp. (strain ORS 278) TaxID=114615 RepID=UPI0001508D68|nr:hypothetical protein [Bradyrhizobium sp. ORS 278]CAL77690.1 hypothetical protein BRADO3932 [Bradyrhizobium sp. ORS 278]